MLVETGVQKLTHKLLVTLMSEVAAIVNSRPITAIPSDTINIVDARDSPAKSAPRKACFTRLVCPTEMEEGSIPR